MKEKNIRKEALQLLLKIAENAIDSQSRIAACKIILENTNKGV